MPLLQRRLLEKEPFRLRVRWPSLRPVTPASILSRAFEHRRPGAVPPQLGMWRHLFSRRALACCHVCIRLLWRPVSLTARPEIVASIVTTAACEVSV